MLLALGRLYKKYNVAMQLHYSCLRSVNGEDVPQARPRYRR